MKLAILGHSPLALEAALRFHLHGAAFTWFLNKDNLSYFESSELPGDAFVSDIGKGVLKELGKEYTASSFNWQVWEDHYERPLLDYLKSHQEIKDDELVSVTKRFLAPLEVINGKSRFHDLFRIIYKVNPKEFINEQKESNPETYQRLTEEFVSSLASSIEMYQDFDLVLDLRNDLSYSSLSVSGRALGEGRRADKVKYALEALETAEGLEATPEAREVALIGSDSLSAEILLSLESWLKDQRSRLFVISHEEQPFKKFLGEANQATARKLNEFFLEQEKEFQGEIEVFTRKLREWQELDDFVQAKMPRPAEPIPRVNFFSGHNVTAVDELIDRKRMFLTLEMPEFREGKKHPENNFLDLKTIGVDLILSGHATKDASIVQVDQSEKGYFDLTPTRPNLKTGWEKDLSRLEGIEDEIFKLFSPVDSH
ncbi:MAG: hypothetical protein ACLGHN_12170 [Bacteriovoracia bacterium]